MNELVLTKESNSNEIELYFQKVFELKKSGNEFPINLDEVWGLVYNSKGKAVNNLKELFFENADYLVFNHPGKNPKGGRPNVEYMLSVACLEYFIARKVREVFEVYRKVFHKVAENVAILSEAQMILNTLMVVQNQNKTIETIDTRLKLVEQNQAIEIKQDYFTILAYCKRNHIHLSFSEAIQKGKLATKLSKEKGFELRQVPDERYGYVKSYKEEILKETFQL